MITDIDILPMNRTYYTEHIKSYNNNKFIYYRENVCFQNKQIAMCYNVDIPKVRKNMFGINSLNPKLNSKEGNGSLGWCTDQIALFEKVMIILTLSMNLLVFSHCSLKHGS